MELESRRDLTLSVIVPTFNRCVGLGRLLDGLEREWALGARFEVVVAVDGSVDGTIERLRARRPSYPLQVLEQVNRGPAAARNHAIGAARGDVLLFLDDDVVPSEGLIERHLSTHRRDEFAVVIGPMLEPPGRCMAPWLRWEAVSLQKQYDAMLAGRYAPTPRQFYTANASLRRGHALAVGGFDERFIRAEDVELAYRLADRGLHFYFVPDAAIFHEPDRTLESWMGVAYEYGRHDVLIDQKRGQRLLQQRAYQEANERHALNRLLTRSCIGHPARLRAVVWMFARMIRYRGPGAYDRLQRALCSALYNIQYWQGVAAASAVRAETPAIPSVLG